MPAMQQPKTGLPPLKIAMIAVTALWVGSIPLVTILAFLDMRSNSDPGPGGAMLFGAACVGLVCPTVLYAIVMAFLAVMHFCIPKD